MTKLIEIAVYIIAFKFVLEIFVILGVLFEELFKKLKLSKSTETVSLPYMKSVLAVNFLSSDNFLDLSNQINDFLLTGCTVRNINMFIRNDMFYCGIEYYKESKGGDT